MKGQVALAAALIAAVLATAGTALAANTYSVSRAAVTPATGGSEASPKPVRVAFGLRVGEEDPRLRPAPIVTYSMGAEGLVTSTRPFAKCSLRQLKRRRGVPRKCAKAKFGGGIAKGAAGLAEDTLLEESVPCNLRLGLYNTGGGLALRVDGQPPQPPSFRSDRIGCTVPVHVAIPVRVISTPIDGVPSTELRFSLPKLLLHPLDGWDASLRTVDVTLKRAVKGSTGFYSSRGCNGGQRTVQVAFVDEQGARSVSTKALGC